MEPQKVTVAGRDRRQSTTLVWVAAPLLALGAAWLPLEAAARGLSLGPWIVPLLVSVGFAVLVWLLRAATAPAAAIGLVICLALAEPRQAGAKINAAALTALVTLFVLTFAATRFGRANKELKKLAERRGGRRASQIVANLGVAALCAAMGWHGGCIAALAEAAADTVSSEIGQAIGGRAWMITTGRRVQTGTDGGISVAGTVAGVIAASVVVGAGGIGGALAAPQALLVFVAACAGLAFDSVLGATVERRGWLGNDLVNFSSTLFAALIVVVWVLI
ncbi:DUF92 domain-containing protein [Edaphobacter dinghuensis]|uniref:TIGR00297 family protein n=1 Tax=Edaphobacter dinghuensis TaxID=1560005 RepID=A0A917M7S6_9BACT|nr:DUF92 domain-containing protein [Edaphobacter dinghuensis]GGG84622.1 hypothetical protein GCM10011585_30490 [Edaphobacter dinghuensis]